MKRKFLLVLASVYLGISISITSISIRNHNLLETFNIFWIILFLISSILLYIRYFKSNQERFKNQIQVLKKKSYQSQKLKGKEVDYKFPFTIESQDIKIFQKFVLTRFPKYILLPSTILFLIMALLVILGIGEILIDFTKIELHIKYFLLSISLIISYNLTRLSQNISNKEIYSGPTRIGDFNFSFNEDGVGRSNEYFQTFYKWECFQYFIKDQNYIYLMFSNFEGLILPIKEIPKDINEALEEKIKDRFESLS